MNNEQKYSSREERDKMKAVRPKPSGKISRGEYARQNTRFLEEMRTQEGVFTLDKSVLYKVITQGSSEGACPTERSIITVHYTGRLTDGRVFDGSRGGTPLAIRLSDLIPGWIVALQKMHVGDRWEVFIPAEMGNGKRPLPGIPGGSTLIFDIELLSVM